MVSHGKKKGLERRVLLGQQKPSHPLYSLKSTRELFVSFRDARPPTDKAWLRRRNAVYCTARTLHAKFSPS